MSRSSNEVNEPKPPARRDLERRVVEAVQVPRVVKSRAKRSVTEAAEARNPWVDLPGSSGKAPGRARDWVAVLLVRGDRVVGRRVQDLSPAGAQQLDLGIAQIDAAVARAQRDGMLPDTNIGDPSIGDEERRLFEQGGFDTAPRREGEPNALAAAAVEVATLLDESLPVADAAALLGVNESRVRQRLTSRPPSLIGIKDGRAWRVPRYQFARGRLVPGLERVIARLPGALHPVALRRFLETASEELVIAGRAVAPIDWLRRGNDPETVAALSQDL